MPRMTERREPLRARVTKAERESVEARAAAEADGNVSELTRRLLAYGLAHMPAGWTPEQPPADDPEPS